MSKEAFERPFMEVIEFDAEDIITTSGVPSDSEKPDPLSPYELPVIYNYGVTAQNPAGSGQIAGFTSLPARPDGRTDAPGSVFF